MAILNPSFEDAGAQPGEAAHWTLQTVASRERIAGFGPVPREAWEGFERWFDLLDELADVTVAIAFFDPLAEGHEDFNEGWGNDLYLTELPTGQIVTAAFGGGAVESFDAGWDNDDYATAWDGVGTVVGVFDGEPVEDFNEQWRSNESYAFAWEDVAGVIAAFDGGAQTVEDYENGWSAATTI